MNNNELQNILDQTIVDFDNSTEATPAVIQSRRERIMQLEEAIKSLPQSVGMDEYNEGRIKHHFAGDIYGRELFIPKGSILVSKIHKSHTLNTLSQGVIAIICPVRGYTVYEAPFSFVSEPFTKRVGIAIEDCVWITSHKTDKTDLKEIENEIIAEDFSQENLFIGEAK